VALPGSEVVVALPGSEVVVALPASEVATLPASEVTALPASEVLVTLEEDAALLLTSGKGLEVVLEADPAVLVLLV
jgi:hypothetical protein